jgi:gamma-glutamyltranspeptidase/glutathione hydrolase
MRVIVILLALFATLTGTSARPQSATGKHGAVATVDRIASQAGIDAMRKGGNAVDAAVAAALTLGVVNGYNSGIGGGCFIVIRRANGEILCVDGRETAPAAASRDVYLRDGKPDAEASLTGALASGTPGELAALDLALKSGGKLSLKEHLRAAAKIAEAGFVIDKQYAAALEETRSDFDRFPSSSAVFLKTDGTAYKEGDIFRQPDLAKTYRSIAKHGLDWFYGGRFAKSVEKWMTENRGLMMVADLKNYRAVLRPPISTDYRGYEVVSFPPPSSGGVHLLEILNILETRGLSIRDFTEQCLTEPERIHFTAEAMKLAFADRSFWLGDPDFVDVPRGLIDKNYARLLARKINMDQVISVSTHGTPEDMTPFSKHTTHLSTADAEGNWVALTATINTHFGSKVVVPGTGVVLNNEMDDFSAQPGASNYFGLVGGEANAIAPGKRPLSSMSPTIVLKDGKPILAVGAAGGPTIITQTLGVIVDVLDFGMDPQTAINQPRFHNQWKPNVLTVERTMKPALIADLEKRGHVINPTTAIAVVQAVGLTPDSHGFVGASDPRAGGTALAW